MFSRIFSLNTLLLIGSGVAFTAILWAGAAPAPPPPPPPPAISGGIQVGWVDAGGNSHIIQGCSYVGGQYFDSAGNPFTPNPAPGTAVSVASPL